MFRLIMLTSLCLGLMACGGGSDSDNDTPERYQVTATASEGGTVRVNNSLVQKGYMTTASVVADDHYQVASVTGCGGKLTENLYQTGVILLDCTIKATFAKKIYKVSVESAVGGQPNVYSTETPYNELVRFVFTADPGYHITSVSSNCGGSLALLTFTTAPISANCSIKPVFELDSATNQTATYLVTVMSSVGGDASPSSLTVTRGDYAKFDLQADAGYHIDSVTSSCGGSLVLIRFTTGKVNADCSIQPHFALNTAVPLTPSNDPSELIEVSGTAAHGAAMKGGLVYARCTDGTGFKGSVVSDFKGNYSGQVLRAALPCALRVTDGSTTYYSIATAAGNTNITPLTTLILSYTSAKTAYDWFYSGNWSTVTTNLVAAQSGFATAMTNAGYSLPSGNFLPFTAPFAVGDAWDGVLDQLQAGIQADNTDLDALVNQMKAGNLSALPVRK